MAVYYYVQIGAKDPVRIITDDILYDELSGTLTLKLRGSIIARFCESSTQRLSWWSDDSEDQPFLLDSDPDQEN